MEKKLLAARFQTVFLIFSLFAGAECTFAQCVGLPSVAALGSNKFPVGLCAPVKANVTYNVSFTSPTPAGKLELVYDWGDGSPLDVFPLTPGLTSYNASRSHNFPEQSDCEFYVTATIYFDGAPCTATRQLQKIASWRTDNFNGSEVKLISPVTKSSEHLVCEGEPIDISFHDETNWNCNSGYFVNEITEIETPNTENRWQQIVYNTPVAGSKIPDVKVNGVAITGGDGVDIVQNYQDPRGVFYMSAPVLLNDKRRRPSLRITAPGGSSPDAPKANDSFELTVRYWNFCNPYDDPSIPGPPRDVINGDHPPVEKTAVIRILPAPAAPVAVEAVTCNGITPEAFSITGFPEKSIINWYVDENGTSLISSGTESSLPVSRHPDWVNASTAGVYKVWASYLPNVAGQRSCESRKTAVTRTIRELITVPQPVVAPPTRICNNTFFTITLAEPQAEDIGGTTIYKWKGSGGVTISNITSNSAIVNVNVTDSQFGDKLFFERTFTVTREYTTSPLCSKSRTYKVTVYKNPVGGILSSLIDVCETSDVDTLKLSGYAGKIQRWELSTNDGPFQVFSMSSEAELFPGKLTPGKYAFRALVSNDNCNAVYSNVEAVDVFAKPATAFAGEDQFICASLESSKIGASNPVPGTGTWSVVSTVPQGIPPPEFSSVNDPNATIKIKQENSGTYVLRWTVSNGSCSDSDDVVIDFGTDPSEADAGDDKNICGAIVSLDGNVPKKGIGQWSVVGGPNGCIGSACNIVISDPASPVSNAELPAENGIYGTYTLRWTIASGGNHCFTKADDVQVTFTQPLQVFAEDVTDICLDPENLQPVSVEGMVTGEHFTGEWVKVSGAGSLSAQPKSGQTKLDVTVTYYPTMEDYVSGRPIQLMLKADPAGATTCLPVSKTINLLFDRRPVAKTTNDTLYTCVSETRLNAETPLYNAVGKWTSNNPDVVFESSNDPNTKISGLPDAPSTTIVTWTVVSSTGSCASVPATVTLIRHELPTVHDVSATLCESSPAQANIILEGYADQVTSLPPAEREITWYSSENAETIIADPEQTRTARNNDVFVARIKSKKTSCWNDAKLTIKARPLPVVTNSTIELCEDFAGTSVVSSVDLNAQEYKSAIASQKNTVITWHHTYENAVENMLPIKAPLNIHKAKTIYARVAYNDIGPYCAQVATLDLKVKSRPAATTILGREAVCQGDLSGNADDMHVEIYQVVPVPGAKYYWEIPGNADSEFKVFGGGKAADFFVLLQFPNVFTGKIKLAIEVNGCRSNVMEKEIRVSPAPVRPTIIGSQFLCGSAESVRFSVSPNNYPSSTYYWEVRRASDNSPGGGYIIEGQSTGAVLLHASEDLVLSVRESNSVCVSAEATKMLTMSNPVRAKASVEKTVDCFGASSGTIVTEIEGGTHPYSFELMPTNELDPDQNGTFGNLSAGSYRVLVTDANGCNTVSNEVYMEQPSPLFIEEISVLKDEDGFELGAHNSSDGEITVRFLGGVSTEDYTVSLMHLQDKDVVQQKGKNQVTFTGLTHGTYRIHVTDANGCVSATGITSIENPPALFAGTIGPDQEICLGETPEPIAEITPAHGGTGNYSYQWQVSSTGNMNESDWTNIEGATNWEYKPQVTVDSVLPTIRYYRRLVSSNSRRTKAEPQVKSTEVPVKLTVYPSPLATLSLSDTLVCEGHHAAVTVNLTRGSAPFAFDFTTGGKTAKHRSVSSETDVMLYNIKSDTTFGLVRLEDRHGCVAEVLPEAVAINAKIVNADFIVLPPSGACEGALAFKWNAEPGTEYRWVWGDGTSEVIPPDSVSIPNRIISHHFARTAGDKDRTYDVMLFAKPMSCDERMVTRKVSVPAAMSLNMVVGDTLLCSGEAITIKDQSLGVASGVWYYRKKGASERLGETLRTGGEITFTFENTTGPDPLEYEILYEALGGQGCQQVFVQSVMVFQEAHANFEVEVTKAYSGSNAQVTVTNTSAPYNSLTYQWSFGDGSVAMKHIGQIFTIDYHSTGTKNIKLITENIHAAALAKSCASTFQKSVDIQHPVLHAAFEATPRAACFPADISATNHSTGANAYHWALSDSTGTISYSNLTEPTFRIVSPGKYLLTLIAGNTSTGLTDTAQIETIEILDAPVASFSVREKVYVGSQLNVMNHSENATDYAWQFGDESMSTMFEPMHAYGYPGDYFVRLIAANNHGQKDQDGDGTFDGELVCIDTTQHRVVVVDGGNIKIPNAFTPSVYGPSGGISSGDALNDIFLPQSEGVVGFRMEIFDRWGALIFVSTDSTIGWDGYHNGVLLPAGVYVYKLTLDLANGSRHTKIGDVTLLR